jgi:hypothetical protein
MSKRERVAMPPDARRAVVMLMIWRVWVADIVGLGRKEYGGGNCVCVCVWGFLLEDLFVDVLFPDIWIGLRSFYIYTYSKYASGCVDSVRSGNPDIAIHDVILNSGCPLVTSRNIGVANHDDRFFIFFPRRIDSYSVLLLTRGSANQHTSIAPYNPSATGCSTHVPAA